MGLFRRTAVPEDPEPPQGVILHWRGRAIGCSVLRDPDADEHGCAAWIAVPGEPVRIAYGEDFRLTATVLPGKCILIADFTPDLSGAESA
jgi:hypothetical protein